MFGEVRVLVDGRGEPSAGGEVGELEDEARKPG